MANEAAHAAVVRQKEDLALVLAAAITADAKSNENIARDAGLVVDVVNRIEAGVKQVDPAVGANVLAGLSDGFADLSALSRATASTDGSATTAVINDTLVELHATSSRGFGTLTYAWTQTAGDTVTLSSATAVSPTYTAPASAQTLTFSVVVTDPTTGVASRAATVDVVITAA